MWCEPLLAAISQSPLSFSLFFVCLSCLSPGGRSSLIWPCFLRAMNKILHLSCCGCDWFDRHSNGCQTTKFTPAAPFHLRNRIRLSCHKLVAPRSASFVFCRFVLNFFTLHSFRKHWSQCQFNLKSSNSLTFVRHYWPNRPLWFLSNQASSTFVLLSLEQNHRTNICFGFGSFQWLEDIQFAGLFLFVVCFRPLHKVCRLTIFPIMIRKKNEINRKIFTCSDKICSWIKTPALQNVCFALNCKSIKQLNVSSKLVWLLISCPHLAALCVGQPNSWSACWSVKGYQRRAILSPSKNLGSIALLPSSVSSSSPSLLLRLL